MPDWIWARKLASELASELGELAAAEGWPPGDGGGEGGPAGGPPSSPSGGARVRWLDRLRAEARSLAREIEELGLAERDRSP